MRESTILSLVSESLKGDVDANAQLSDILEENGLDRTPLDQYKQYIIECANIFNFKKEEFYKNQEKDENGNLIDQEYADWDFDDEIYNIFSSFLDDLPVALKRQCLNSSYIGIAWEKMYS